MSIHSRRVASADASAVCALQTKVLNKREDTLLAKHSMQTRLDCDGSLCLQDSYTLWGEKSLRFHKIKGKGNPNSLFQCH